MVEVEHQDTQALLGAHRPASFAFQHLFQIAAVAETGERIADRLIAQGLAQADVGYGEADLLGEHVDREQDGLGYFTGRDHLEIKSADRFAVRQQRQADVGGIGRRHLSALGRVISGEHDVHLPGAESPTVLRSKNIVE
ncbi:MAG TPA: hypothetical protein VIX37_04850 [Candidatus Sulfotelmatobacter sp.]